MLISYFGGGSKKTPLIDILIKSLGRRKSGVRDRARDGLHAGWS